MEKILLLSTFGREHQLEDLASLDLYLFSLKRHIIPNFDTKVILLYTGSGDLSKTRERITQLELDNVVSLKSIVELDLPQKSLNFWYSQIWFHKVGLNMNLLFDYAKRNNYFDAEWIMHVDTDLEFLPNFKTIFDKINSLREINPNILVTLAGDTFNYHFKHQDKEYIMTDPTRIDWYAESGETLKNSFVYRNIEIKQRERPTESVDYNNLVFCLQQQKIRNDFVIMPKVTANQYGSSFNWISYHYPSDFKAIDETKPEQLELQHLFENHNPGNKFTVNVNNDKGSAVQLFIQGGEHTITKLQLFASDQMIRHYGSGWYMGENFVKRAYSILQKEYSEYADLYQLDFIDKDVGNYDIVTTPHSTSIDELRNILAKLEAELGQLKELINLKTSN